MTLTRLLLIALIPLAHPTYLAVVDYTTAPDFTGYDYDACADQFTPEDTAECNRVNGYDE